MHDDIKQLKEQIVALRRSARLSRLMATVALVLMGTMVTVGMSQPPKAELDEVRAKKFVLVDDAGVVRAMLHQDPKHAQRLSRAAGLTLFDNKGSERGGFATLDNGSVSLGMDAPHGVGAAMPDRIGLTVHADGSSYIMIIDNRTYGVVRMDSDASGDGGLKLFKWDPKEKKVHTRKLNYDGETKTTQNMGN